MPLRQLVICFRRFYPLLKC